MRVYRAAKPRHNAAAVCCFYDKISSCQPSRHQITVVILTHIAHKLQNKKHLNYAYYIV